MPVGVQAAAMSSKMHGFVILSCDASGMHAFPPELTVPVSGPIDARVRPPGSKSVTNRALICAAMAEGTSVLEGALESEDTIVMQESLARLGVKVEAKRDDAGNASTLIVEGSGGDWPVRQADLYLANSGTSIRFLTAALAAGHGTYRLDGVERMRQRPIGDLLEPLRRLGAQAICPLGSNCPPVELVARGLTGGEVSVSGEISSQYLSGLLMASPYAQGDVTIAVDGRLVSVPYVEMTCRVMESFGVRVERGDFSRFLVPAPQRYRGTQYAVEPDASAASYFWAAAAVTGGRVLVEGLRFDALQGDVEFCSCLAAMGCEVEETPYGIYVIGTNKLRGIETDMNAISDTVQTLAVVALFAEGPTEIRGVEHIRHKETDRIGDLARELRKFGAEVMEFRDGLRIEPGPLRPAAVDTYNDHRMAMSFAIAGLRIEGVVLRNPACVTKTYPRFFEDLARISTPIS